MTIYFRAFDLLSEENFLLYEFIYSSPRTAHKNSQNPQSEVTQSLSWMPPRKVCWENSELCWSHWGLWPQVTGSHDFRNLISSTSNLSFPSWNLCLQDDLIVVTSLGFQQACSVTIALTFDWYIHLLPARVYKNGEIQSISQSNKL